MSLLFTGNYRKDNGHGDWRRRDHHNLVKPLIDAVFAALGCDDKRAVKVIATKEHGPVERVRITITELQTGASL